MSHRLPIRVFVLSLFLIAGGAFFPSVALADAGGNCIADLTTPVPDTTDWRRVTEVNTETGSTWRRGFINEPAGEVMIAEDAEYMISGITEPGAITQIYIFAADYGDADFMKKPDMGTCFQAETADENGFFRLKVNSEILWSGIGRDFVIDVFYKLPVQSEDSQEDTGMNYAVSTGIMPKTVQVLPDPKVIKLTEDFGADADPAQRQPYYYDAFSNGFTDADRNIDGECKELCDKLPLLRGVELQPWKIKPALLGDNLDATSGLPAEIGRLMHTYYVGIPGQVSLQKADVEEISEKALAMELIKREFGIGPWVNEQTIRAFADRGGGAKYIRDLLLGIGDRPELEQQLKQVTHIPDSVSLAALFPANSSTEELWAKDFLELVSFWTGNLAMNTCLLLNDPDELESFFDGFQNGVIDNLVSTEYACHFVETHGKTPRLLLNTLNPVALTPDFKDVQLTYADQSFVSGKNAFDLPEGQKQALYYRYRFTTPFRGELSGDICVSKIELPNLIEEVSSKFQLSAQETVMVAQELHENFPATNERVNIRIADPTDIANKFKWFADKLELNIFRLFFKYERTDCGQKSFDLPNLKRSENEAGFETGVL